MKRTIVAVLVGALVVPLAASAGAATASARLTQPLAGVVDFSDTLRFAVEGAGCSGVEVGVRLTSGRHVVTGPKTTAAPDRRTGGRCAGSVVVPDEPSLRRLGWRPGQPVDAALVSTRGSLPLRFQRFELERGTVAAGRPQQVPAADPDTQATDRGLRISTGDAIDLGRVDVSTLDGVGIRVCDIGGASTVPSFVPTGDPTIVTVRVGSPSGDVLVGPSDLVGPGSSSRADAVQGCYRLASLSFTKPGPAGAPRLFLVAEDVPADSIIVSAIDFNGTGARLPRVRPAAPAGTRVLFDGSGFGAVQADDCILAEGAATTDPAAQPNARGITGGQPLEFWGCDMISKETYHNAIFRLKVRRKNFGDNGGIYLGNSEIQLRTQGEFLPGGYLGQYGARWQKFNAWPAYTEMQVVQLGDRVLVRVNGRTVTDVVLSTGDPAPYLFKLRTQIYWSDNSSNPTSPVGDKSDIWFDDVSAYSCTSPTDPVCLAAVRVAAANAADVGPSEAPAQQRR